MPRYSRSAGKDVERAMRKYKRGKLKSGRGGKVKSRKQAIAIGLSEARAKGKKVPRKEVNYSLSFPLNRSLLAFRGSYTTSPIKGVIT